MALSDSLYAYYKLDEASGGALDSVGGKTLSNFGPVIDSGAGIINTARNFHGSGGTTLIRNANTTDFFCGANPFAFSFWVKFTSMPTSVDWGLANRYEPAGQREYIVFLSSGNFKIQFLCDNGTTSFGVSYPPTAVTGTWYHVAGGWDGTTMKLAVNNSTFITTPFAGPMVNGGDNFKLGLEAGSLNGLMDEFAFWVGRCITQAEVSQLYNGGAGLPFSAFGGPPPPTVWNSDGSAANVQAIHDASTTIDGDTITIPAGSFVWTTTVNITKAITLSGLTTVNSATGVCNDVSIIRESVTRPPSGAIRVLTLQVDPTKTFLARITGLSVTSDSQSLTGGSQGPFVITSTTGAPTYKFRWDNCHFYALRWNNLFWNFEGTYGVIDHIVTDTMDSSFMQCLVYNGGAPYGDQVFTQNSNHGGPDFIFFEDWWINNTNGSTNTAGGFNAHRGGKYVIRHSYLHNCEILCHWTGSVNRERAGRAMELYNNHYDWSTLTTMDGITGGTLVAHHNTFTGAKPRGWSLQAFRWFGVGANFGGCDGTSGWDINATEPDGSHIDGHPPYIFLQGNATGGSAGTLIDTTKNWSTNQWKGFVAKKTSDGKMSLILNNTATVLTLSVYTTQTAVWAAGDQYTIRKVNKSIDQPGLGQGDLLSGPSPTPVWLNQVLEGCYSWNNTYTDNTTINFAPPQEADTFILEGRDYFSDTPMPGYTPYPYPHPNITNVTRVIALTGPGGSSTIAFGNVIIGSTSPTMNLTVANQGNALLTVSGVSYPTGFSGATGGFTVAAGSSFVVVVTFTPLLAQLYSGNITVSSDATAGTNTIAVSGTGVNPIPPPGVHGHRKQARDAFGL